MRGNRYLHALVIVFVLLAAAVVAYAIKDDTPVSSPQTTYTQVRVIVVSLADYAKAHVHYLYHLL